MKRKMSSIDDIKSFGPLKQAVYLKLPYMGISSEKMVKSLRDCVKETFFSAQLNVVFKTQPLMSTNKKDRIPPKSKSNIVYKFSCKHCESVYIGRSYRRLEDRISEHIPSSIRKSHAQNTDPSKFNSTEEAIQSIISHYRLRSRPKEVPSPTNQLDHPAHQNPLFGSI